MDRVEDQNDGQSSKRPRRVFQYEWPERLDFASKLRGLKDKKMKKMISSFSTAELVRDRNEICPVEGLRTWGEEDLMVTDRDGTTILYYLADGLRRPYRNKDPGAEGLKALEKFILEYPPVAPKKTDSRHKGSKHKEGEGVHYIALWHGIGRGTDPAVVSSDVIGRGWKLNAVMRFLKNFTPVTQSVGALLFGLEPEEYAEYRELFSSYVTHGAGAVFHTTVRNCFMGMAILTGVCCKPHHDSRDKLHGWVVDTAFGEFEGGKLQVPQVDLEFEMKTGSVIIMKSALLQHSVSEVTSGRRIGVVFFSHENNFQETFDAP